MFVLRAFLFWTLISTHVVGAAWLFRRFFPRESVWLGFIVPEIVLVLVCNFIEHHVALTQLRLLLPVTTVGAIAAILFSRCSWRVMRLPTLLFLGVFAFTLLLRLLRPNILDIRDGPSDLGIVCNFMFGQTLPAESAWLPPLKMIYYYCLEHYGASVLIRLLGVDVGTGFNLSAALLSAYLYFLVGAVSWHLGRGKLWIVLTTILLTACAGTGDTAYLWLTESQLEPENVINPYSMLGDPDFANNLFLQHLTPIADAFQRHELMPPGYGSWMGLLHSSQTGQVLICFTLFTLIELLRRKRTNWPWICLLLAPFLMLTTCAWGVPLVGFIMIAGGITCWRLKRFPANWAVILCVSAGLLVMLEPMLSYFLNWVPSGFYEWATGRHTQPLEFFAQWWPIFLPWLLLCFVWRQLHPATCIVVIMTPLAFAVVETWNFGMRYDMTAKLWGMIYAVAWMTFLPEIMRQRTWPFRMITVWIALASALSFCFWATYYHRVVRSLDVAHLEGHGQLRLDLRKARILEILSRLDGQIIIPGRTSWAYSEDALLSEFSHNRAYVTWGHIADADLYTNGLEEGYRRGLTVNNLYDGKNDQPLLFLRQRDIAALVIYPDDDIDPAVVERLKKALAPYYTYEDVNFREEDEISQDLPSSQRPCAGVFIYRPEVAALKGAPAR